MSKMTTYNYRLLKSCLLPVNGYVNSLHEKYVKTLSSTDFIQFKTNNIITDAVLEHLKDCDSIVTDIGERATHPIEKSRLSLTRTNFSTEEQKLIKHCIHGARTNVKEFLNKLFTDEFSFSLEFSASSEFSSKTYQIPKTVLESLFDTMLPCTKLPLNYDEW